MAEPALPVIDSSPVILLARVGRIDLLSLLSETILVPRAVADEIRAKGPEDPAVVAIGTPGRFEVVDSPRPSEAILDWELGAGEQAVLAWASGHPGSLAIIDDAEARRCARTIGVPVIGTLGIVLRAKSAGALDKARPTVEGLIASGMYVSESTKNEALALVGE